MVVIFDQQYLRDLFTMGKTDDKHHRFQPEIVKKYIKVVNIMLEVNDVNGLLNFNSLHYEHLQGDKVGKSSVRINDKYRIEFTESHQGESLVANICTITELSNHYK